MRILILGGTRFLGIEFCRTLQNQENIEIHVGSRHAIDHVVFHEIDRKNEQQLTELLSIPFDLIIDFICFSAPDAQKLLNAIKHNEKQLPFLITISTTNVYGEPFELSENSCFSEIDFDPANYEFSFSDRPQVDYRKGKMSMEACLHKGYPLEMLSILRFPIILGKNDYTKRTAYFMDVIKNRKRINFNEQCGRSNFITVTEAADIVKHITGKRFPGIYNCALQPAMNQKDLFELYCKYYNVEPLEYYSSVLPETISPFYYNRDFLISTSKLSAVYKEGIPITEALHEQLRLIG